MWVIRMDKMRSPRKNNVGGVRFIFESINKDEPTKVGIERDTIRTTTITFLLHSLMHSSYYAIRRSITHSYTDINFRLDFLLVVKIQIET